MSFRGELLKPSEKNGTARATKPSRGISKTSRYEVLKEKIRTWWHDRLKIGEALREIRDSKLYKDEYPNFEDFCVEEFDLKHTQAYALISAIQVKESLEPSAMAERITNERQARALKSVPVEQRAEVVEKAAEKGAVTAKAITEAAREIVPAKQESPAPKAEKQKHLDKTGYPIPDSILTDWQIAESFRSTLSDLQRIKLQIEKAIDKRDLIYREVGQDTVADLKNAWTALKQVLPYAVCPTCQGRTREKCSVCKQRGFVSEFGYTHWFAKEVIELREKAIKQ